jgi:ribosomal subunit interface protein
MRLEVRGKKLSVTQAMRAYAERRLRFSLGRFETHLSYIRVRLEDVNGPRGGVDKRCAIALGGPRFPTTVVEADDSDVYVAIDRAARAAFRAVSTVLSRYKQRPVWASPLANEP